MSKVRPQTGSREPMLDGWRGLALVGVLVDHFFTRYGANLGRFGVELFFVLSGRLMAQILFDRQAPLGEFFYRRFTRIYPVLFVFAIALFLWSDIFHEGIMPRAFASVLTLTANYFSILSMRTEGYDHIWSLCIEQHAYIILGFIALLQRTRKDRALKIILVLAGLAMVNGAICTWVLHQKYNQVYWRTDVRGASILVGAAAYMILRIREDWPPVLRHAYVPVVAGALGLLLNLNVVPDPIKYSAGTILVAVCLNLLEEAPAWMGRILSFRPLTFVGLTSYSIYVWQEPFAEFGPPEQRYLFLPFALVCGLLSYYLVEGPARHMLNRLWLHFRPQDRPTPAPAVPGPAE